MVKTTIYLDPELALAVRQMASLEQKTQAEIIREAITVYTRQTVHPKPKGIGRYHSGRSDVSGRAEELLRHAVRKRRWR